MWQTLETKAKFIAQVMSGDMTIRRLEDLDSAALTYAEVKAIASGNPPVIEKAQVDAELIRLTRLRSAHAEEQYRIRSNLRRSHEGAGAFTGRLTNLRQDIAARQDTSGDKFSIELDGQTLDNRGIAGELIVRRAEKVKNRFGDDVRVGRFAGFDFFLAAGLSTAFDAGTRWLLGLALNSLFIALPLGTLAAYLIGGYLVGIAVGVFHINTHFPLAWKLFAITGFLGGLTTFSTFSAEVVERLLAGQPAWAIGLASVHLAGSLTATYVGLLTVGATRIWG